MSGILASIMTLLRFLFAAFLAFASLGVALIDMPVLVGRMTKRRFDILFLLVLLVTHFGVFVLVFFGLHQQPHSDLPAAYVPEAHAVMKGMLPYRDFISSYAPLNPYLDAAVLKIKDSALTLVAFQILCDAAAVPFWIGFLRRCLPEVTVRRAALLYLLQPLVIWDICLDGKNHGCISLLMAISMYCIARRETLSGISYGLSLVLVKILPSIFLPALFFGARRRWVWLASAMALPIVVYGSFWLSGLDITVPIRLEGNKSTPGNVPYFLFSFIGRDIPKGAVGLVTLAVLGAVVIYACLAQLRTTTEPERLWTMALSVLVILFALLTANKKALPAYLEMCFFLICAFTALHAEAKRRSVAYLYALLSLIGLSATSFWFTPLGLPNPVQLHSLFMAGDRNGIIEMALQALVLISFLGLGVRMLRDLHGPRIATLVARDESQEDSVGLVSG
jgi:hypothetical protein